MKAKSITKRVLSAVLCAVMLFSCWVFTAPSASAATAGDYTIVIYSNCSDDCDNSRKEKFEFIIEYKTNNGTGTSGTKYLDIGSSYTSKGDKSHSCTIPGFPTKITLHLNTKFNWGWGTVKAKITKVTVQGQDISFPSTECSSSTGDNSKSNDVPADKYPYAASITDIGGDASVAVNTDGTSNTVKTYSLGTVKDQYGVNWYQDATWDTATLKNDVTFSNGVLTVPANSNRDKNYTVTLNEKCGNASNTKTVTISTFDYKVTFYDEDGKKVLKAEQTVDYGASATAPDNPTKSDTNTYDYEFDKWTGDNYETITSGKQTKSVKASYTATPWEYTIRYYGSANTVIDTDKIGYSGTLTVPTNVAKESTPQYDFEFIGWKEGTTSTYSPTAKTTDSGVVVLSNSKKPSNLGMTYTAREKNYAAYFKANLRSYDITFSYRDADNNWQPIVRKDVTYGETPTAPKAGKMGDEGVEIPKTIVTASTTFTFTGWDTEVSSVKGTKIYTAQYASAPTPYDITFKWVNPDDPTGALLSDTKSVGYDLQPEEPTVPNYETKLATYSFTGWSSEVVKVTGDATYTALYENPEYHQYSIVFQNEDGTELSNTNYHWNHKVTAQADPSKAATAQYTYTFKGWIVDGDESNVVAGSAIDGKTIAQLATEGHDSHTYKAKFTATVNQYTITYKDEDGNVIKTVPDQDYGTVPADLTGANAAPALSEKDPDDTNHYTAYWYNESEKTLNDAITGDTVFSNLYKATAHKLGEVTTKEEATCVATGIDEQTCSVCNHVVQTVTPINPLGHDRKPESVAPDDNTEGYECFHCTRCGNYWAAVYNEDTKNYDVVNPDTNGEKDAANVKGGSTPVPAPFFNSYATDPSEEGFDYNYSYRDSSLKLMKDAYVDTENTRQDFRFSGSVTIPEGVSYQVDPSKNVNEVDNVILDFGFVYTQDWYNQGENSGYGAAKLTLENVAKYSTGYAKMSVVENNHNDKIDNGAFNGSNWSGVTYHPKTAVRDVETLTFNLVISMKAKNWKKQYAARPYITYKYRGVVYTVYDGGASDQSVTYSFGSVYAIAAASISLYQPGEVSDTVLDYVNTRIIANRDDFGTDAATDWWRWYNEYKTYEENLNTPTSSYNKYINALNA